LSVCIPACGFLRRDHQDRCLPDALEPAVIEEIIKVANEAEPKLTRLVARLIAEV